MSRERAKEHGNAAKVGQGARSASLSPDASARPPCFACTRALSTGQSPRESAPAEPRAGRQVLTAIGVSSLAAPPDGLIHLGAGGESRRPAGAATGGARRVRYGAGACPAPVVAQQLRHRPAARRPWRMRTRPVQLVGQPPPTSTGFRRSGLRSSMRAVRSACQTARLRTAEIPCGGHWHRACRSARVSVAPAGNSKAVWFADAGGQRVAFTRSTKTARGFVVQSRCC